jgi:hypothetical protein
MVKYYFVLQIRMKKVIIIIVLVVSVFLFFGCNNPQPQEPVLFKNIEGTSLPVECENVKDDVCGVFSCTVDLCWCREGPDQVLYEANVTIDSKEKAEDLVREYFSQDSSLGSRVMSSVKLNDIFYNVFVESIMDDDRLEKTYTVGIDGTIIQTVCGV